MDKLIYTAATGAKQAMARQDTLAHNLANANSAGYRADTTAFRAVPIRGVGEGTRVFTLETMPGVDLSPGTLQHTGRMLDVALTDGGFLAVRALDGTEAYTRAGALEVNAEGVLQTRSGLEVIGDGGPIVIPADSRIEIARDGTISATLNTGQQNIVNVVGRIKMVNAGETEMVKGGDGLLRPRDGGILPLDETVGLSTGSLEGSNVNVVEAMIGMISVARQFEMQMRVLRTAEADARAAAQLLNVSS